MAGRGGALENRPLGVALYADLIATAQDWAQYQAGWNRPAAR